MFVSLEKIRGAGYPPEVPPPDFEPPPKPPLLPELPPLLFELLPPLPPELFPVSPVPLEVVVLPPLRDSVTLPEE